MVKGFSFSSTSGLHWLGPVKLKWFHLPCPERMSMQKSKRMKHQRIVSSRELFIVLAACSCAVVLFNGCASLKGCLPVQRRSSSSIEGTYRRGMLLFATQQIVEDMGPPSSIKVSKLGFQIEVFQLFLRPTSRKSLNGYNIIVDLISQHDHFTEIQRII